MVKLKPTQHQHHFLKSCHSSQEVTMDTLTRGVFSGFLASTLYGAASWLLYATAVLPSSPFHYNAVFIAPPGTTLTTLLLALGFVTFLITGALSGVVIAYLIRRTGLDFAWLKGAGVGAVLWPVHTTFLPAIKPEVLTTLPMAMIVSTLIFSVLWGFATGVIYKALLVRTEAQQLH
jgi:hypothetical protein